eukprot:11160893-Heterocapsa_arctica.AAC.1
MIYDTSGISHVLLHDHALNRVGDIFVPFPVKHHRYKNGVIIYRSQDQKVANLHYKSGLDIV